jgi:hypothetical protein
MSRLALTAALSLAALGSGCIITSAEDSTGSVDLFWQFDRTTWDNHTVLYDPESATPGGTGACLESRVDEVVVTLPSGSQISVACRNQGSQGVALDGIGAGRRSFTLTGYRGGVALYRSTVQVDVLAGSPSSPVRYLADVFGIPDNLDVFFDFADPSGRVISGATCASEGVDFFTFNMFDRAGTAVVSTTMFPGQKQACSDASPGPGVALDAIDRDLYTIRARAYRNGVAAPIYDSCDTVQNTSATFLHDGADTSANGWAVLVLYTSCP